MLGVIIIEIRYNRDKPPNPSSGNIAWYVLSTWRVHAMLKMRQRSP